MRFVCLFRLINTGHHPGDGGFPIQIGGGFLYNTYPDVSCMYPACILHVFRCVPFRYIKIH